LKGRKCFRDFHVSLFSEVQPPLGRELPKDFRDIAPEDRGCLCGVQYSQIPG
jgi:hypothetical protein